MVFRSSGGVFIGIPPETLVFANMPLLLIILGSGSVYSIKRDTLAVVYARYLALQRADDRLRIVEATAEEVQPGSEAS